MSASGESKAGKLGSLRWKIYKHVNSKPHQKAEETLSQQKIVNLSIPLINLAKKILKAPKEYSALPTILPKIIALIPIMMTKSSFKKKMVQIWV